MPDGEQPGEPDPAGDPPPDLKLVINPAELPQRYVDWYNRSLEAGDVRPDDLLVLAPGLAADGRTPLQGSYLLNRLQRRRRQARRGRSWR